MSYPTPNLDKELFAAEANAELDSFLHAGYSINFLNQSTPDVSVVLVLWNQAQFTLRALKALTYQTDVAFEVIIVDNGSTDDTSRLLERVQGAKIIRNVLNMGFLRATNRGALEARGRSILLLNSDAFIRPGGLRAALDTLDADPSIGAVGARLILPSGRLQEAGSILWSDGSALGYGRGIDPDSGEAMFRRNVDYASGAFLLIRSDQWRELKGFDEDFAPAYYEEADLCLRLRARGYKVVYEPAATVDHFEFGSETKKGEATELQRRNRKIFNAKHRRQLLLEHLPPSQSNILFARTSTIEVKPRLLVIDDFVPFDSLGSGFPRSRLLVQTAVDLGWFVSYFPTNQLAVDWARALSSMPPGVEIISNTGAQGLERWLSERLSYYQVIIVSRPHNMVHLKGALKNVPHFLDGVRLLYDAEALYSSREALKAVLMEDPLTPEQVNGAREAELALASGVDGVVCVNEAEATTFKRDLPEAVPVHVLSYCPSVEPLLKAFGERSGFLFVGRLLETEAPNWQGLNWFVRQCWPAIRHRIPGAKLSVIGQVRTDAEEISGPGIEIHGPVDDLRPVYGSHRVFIAPVRFAAGVPIKVLDACGAGLPVVGTRLMAEQLSWLPGLEMFAPDDPEAFANAAVRLHEEERTWTLMQKAALGRLHQDHGSARFVRSLTNILNGPETVALG